jgi:hypothetical protein
MHENMCSPRPHAPSSTSREQINVRAADLAEWIVDEISEADQDWHAIQRRARELLELATRRANAPPSRSAPCSRSP